MAIQLRTIYPTPFWLGSSELTAAEIEALRDLAIKTEKDLPALDKSNKGFSYHSPLGFAGNIKTIPGGNKIVGAFLQASKDYGYSLREVTISYWTIVSRKYSYNARHAHGEALLSGVLYIEAPEGSGALKFSDPRPSVAINSGRWKDKMVDEKFHRDLIVPAQQGLLVIFPGYLEHEVTMTLSETPRIIYSFNLKPL